MRMFNSRQFQPVWNFSISLRRFPPGCLWRVKSGSYQNSPSPPYPSLPSPKPPLQPPFPHPTSLTSPSPSSLLTRDTSNLICQHSHSCNPIFSRDVTNAQIMFSNPQMSQSHPRKYICLSDDQSPGKYWIQKLVGNFQWWKLQLDIIGKFCTLNSHCLANWCRKGDLTWVQYFQTTNNQLCSCLTLHTW